VFLKPGFNPETQKKLTGLHVFLKALIFSTVRCAEEYQLVNVDIMLTMLVSDLTGVHGSIRGIIISNIVPRR